MAVLEIRVVPDAILRTRAREVRVIDGSIRKLARDMIETMQAAPGVGLAANQVGVLKRVIVLQMPEKDPQVLVNPQVTLREGERQLDEGCLSVPGYMGLVTRSVRIKARALDEWGAKLRISAEELLAQAIEHEVDHLNGILYLDHLVSHDQLRKVEPEQPGMEGPETHHSAHAPVDPRVPHMHDVTYKVHADHGGGWSEDGGRDEVLTARAKLHGLTPDASMTDLAFDLSSAKAHRKPVDGEVEDAAKRVVRRRVRSADPAIDGGVALEKRAGEPVRRVNRSSPGPGKS